MSHKNDATLHIAMYPWLAMSHITTALRIGNKLAEKGHKITLFLPAKTQLRFTPQNHHPDLITFVTVTLPPVDGLPSWAETTNDIPANVRPLLMTAIDGTKDTIEAHLVNLKPDFVFFDFAYWIPNLARKHGLKSMYYFSALLCRVAYQRVAYQFQLANDFFAGRPISKAHLMSRFDSFPNPLVKMQAHEAQSLLEVLQVDFGGGMTFLERLGRSLRECDAIGIQTGKDMDEVYCNYTEEKFGKPILLAGPVLLDPPTTRLDGWMEEWLAGYASGEVVYCAFGSECILDKNLFQELVLGLELIGKPFLAALKPPRGYETIESALPDGFKDRTKGRGIVYGGWVQQQLILQHPSIGCFITHSGVESLNEAMVNKCQLVIIPNAADQFVIARMMSCDMRIGVEVERREEDGFFTREAVNKAVSTVMDDESEVGREVRANHAKWRDFILKEGGEESYIQNFIKSLQQLLL